MLQCIALEEGFDENKTNYIPVHFIQKIVEFDTFAEYKARYRQWEDEENEKKFKNDY